MKKVIAIIICFVVLVFVALPQQSDAALSEGLIVGGAAVMTAALAVDTLIVAAGGAGMMDAIRKTAQNNGMTVSQFMSNEYADFRNGNGENLNASLTRFVNGFYFTPAGQLILSYELGHYITQFLNQLWSEDGGNVVSNATGVENWPESINVNGYEFKKVVLTEKVDSLNSTKYFSGQISNTNFRNGVQIDSYYYASTLNVGKPNYAIFYGNKNICIISPVSILSNWYSTVTINGTAQNDGKPGVYGSSSYSIQIDNTTGAYYGVVPGTAGTSTTVEYADLNTVSSRPTGFVAGEVFDALAPTMTYTENPDVYNLPQDKEDHSSVLDIPEVILPDSAADVGSGTINIGDYLQSLANALATDATVDLTVTLENEATADIPLTLEQDIPVDVVAENDVAVGEKEDVATETDAAALEPYMLNLTDFFPFCIPFDIYKMLNLFSASAQSPHFQWRIYAPNIVDYMIDIDLSGFDQAAQVLRTVELIAFAVALAFATKKIIQGGD